MGEFISLLPGIHIRSFSETDLAAFMVSLIVYTTVHLYHADFRLPSYVPLCERDSYSSPRFLTEFVISKQVNSLVPFGDSYIGCRPTLARSSDCLLINEFI